MEIWIGPAGGCRTLALSMLGRLSRTGLSRILIESPVTGSSVSAAGAGNSGGGESGSVPGWAPGVYP